MFHVYISRKSFLTYSPQGLKDSGKFKNLSPDAWSFLECLEDEDASHVIVVTTRPIGKNVPRSARSELVGWLRCTQKGDTLYAQGTWVEKSYRRRGVAKLLWMRAVKRFKPQFVQVDAASPGGRALVRGLRNRYPKISFLGSPPPPSSKPV